MARRSPRCSAGTRHALSLSTCCPLVVVRMTTENPEHCPGKGREFRAEFR